MSPAHFRRLYRLSAFYDLAVTWPYMTPFTLSIMWQLLDGAHDASGLPPLPALTTYAVLFANFFGTIVVIWSVLRLRLNDPILARYDAVGRFAFSTWMLVALLNGASPLIWGFFVIELSFAVLQFLPVRPGTPDAVAST